MSDKKQWYEKRTWVVIWLIFCLPIGLFGLIKNHKFKARTKWILGTIFMLIFVAFMNGVIREGISQAKIAEEAGYPNYSVYKEAQELGLQSYGEYQQYKDQKRQREQKKKEEAKRLKEFEDTQLRINGYTLDELTGKQWRLEVTEERRISASTSVIFSLSQKGDLKLNIQSLDDAEPYGKELANCVSDNSDGIADSQTVSGVMAVCLTLMGWVN